VYYYRPGPVQFAVAPPAPLSGRPVVPQAQAPAQVDPRYVASMSPGQLRGSQQSQAGGYRLATAPAAQADPRYTGSVAAQPVHASQAAPANYRTAKAQPVQPSAQYAGSAPAQQVRGLFSANYQVATGSQAGAYSQPGQYAQQPVRQQLAFGYTTQPQQG